MGTISLVNDPAIEQGQLLFPKHLAARLNVTVETLANWRSRGLGPTYTKLTPGPQGRVRYRLDDVVAWERTLERHVQTVNQAVNAEFARQQ